jgi:murein DD-endopeptidase MepM/ murein hydrolase activator NlpD
MRFLAVLLLAAGAGGCSSVLVKMYGYGHTPPSGGVEITMPADAPSITQAFRPLSAVPNADPMGEHDGIDIIARTGTPILAAAPGRVVRSHLTFSRGNRVVVEHGEDEKGRTFRTEYVHLHERLAATGDEVARGQQIGELGMTGLTAGFPHLHFMVVVIENDGEAEYEKPVDPHLYWADGEGAVTCFDGAGRWGESPPVLTYPVPCR